jgi:hypothetical protein
MTKESPVQPLGSTNCPHRKAFKIEMLGPIYLQEVTQVGYVE